jgi:hypothetical protein
VQHAVVNDVDVFRAALPVTEERTEVEVPFASLKQMGYGKPVAWTSGTITGVTIDARNVVGKPAVYGDFFLEIDRIRVY